MILKSTLLAVVVFLGSLTVAEAQSQSYVNGGLALGWGNPPPSVVSHAVGSLSGV